MFYQRHFLFWHFSWRGQLEFFLCSESIWKSICFFSWDEETWWLRHSGVSVGWKVGKPIGVYHVEPLDPQVATFFASHLTH